MKKILTLGLFALAAVTTSACHEYTYDGGTWYPAPTYYPSTCDSYYDPYCTNHYPPSYPPAYPNYYPPTYPTHYPSPHYPTYPGPHYNPHPWGPHVGHYLAGPAQTASPAQQLADHYGIQVASAEKFIAIASGHKRGQALKELGVSKSEVKPLADLEMPSQATIQKIAASLGEDSVTIERMMSDFVSDIRQAQQN